jgi:hypothetical protein
MSLTSIYSSILAFLADSQALGKRTKQVADAIGIAHDKALRKLKILYRARVIHRTPQEADPRSFLVRRIPGKTSYYTDERTTRTR